ncbi:MAG: hypothetical protein AABW59_02370 [archaeon]
MAKVEKERIILSAEEAILLKGIAEVELIPNQKGVFLLIDKGIMGKNEGKEVCVQVPAKEKPSDPKEETRQEVAGLIKKGKLSELVEGKFEATLNEKQRKALLEMVVSGKIYVFKLNETYKKGVYRLNEEAEAEKEREKKDSENFGAPEKPIDEYNLGVDGFIIARYPERARNLSMEYETPIREGKLKGMKSFDGNYYLISTELLEAYIQKTMIAFGSAPTMTLEDLAKNTNASLTLTRIVCDYLKEEGELIEKKKGQYTYIK